MFLQQIDKSWTPGTWGNDKWREENHYLPFEVPEKIELMTLEEADVLSHREHVLCSLWLYKRDGTLQYMQKFKDLLGYFNNCIRWLKCIIVKKEQMQGMEN